MRGAIYARVSTENQEKDGTIESQVLALISKARDLQLEIPSDLIFRDDGFSGSRLDRPALDLMRDAAADGRFQCLLVYDADRLARNFVHQELIMEEMEKLSIRIEFIQGHASKVPEERHLSQVKGIFAEYERTKILERTRRGKMHRAKYQGWLSWSTVPYGFSLLKSREGTRVQVNEEEADWIRQIYSWFLEKGMSTRHIADRLNELGVKTRRGNRWYAQAVRNVLTYPPYAGSAYYNRTESSEPAKRRNPHRYPRQLKSRHKVRPKDQWIIIPVPPIVSEEDQIAAREKLTSNKRNSPRKTKYHYLLRRLVVCGECGRKMTCISQRAKGKDLRYPYYACVSKEWVQPDQQCRARGVRADWLDDSVWDSMKAWLRSPDVLRAELNSVLSIAEAGEAFSQQWNNLDSLIRGYERQITRVTDAYQAGAMELSDFMGRKETLSEKISDARRRKDELSSMRQKQIDVERVLADIDAFSETLRNGLDTMEFDARRSVVELLVEKVVVKGEEVTVENVVPLRGRFSVLKTEGRNIPQGG